MPQISFYLRQSNQSENSPHLSKMLELRIYA